MVNEWKFFNEVVNKKKINSSKLNVWYFFGELKLN